MGSAPPLPPGFREIVVPSSLDGSPEPSLLHVPAGKVQALCVALHSWSFDRFNQIEPMLPFCRARDWALLLPEFRGPNLRSNPRARQAGGSAAARRDIVDATRHVLHGCLPSTVPAFLIGGSGGAHMALLTAAKEDFAWTAVSSWCPITDLATWYEENPERSDGVEAVCGGAPGSSPMVDREFADRSPIHCADALAWIRLQLAHGRHDPLVPYTQSWNLARRIEDFGSDSFYFHLFDGGHDLLPDQAFAFFDQSLKQAAAIPITG